MEAASMLMPALRLRWFSPLTEDDGSCSLVYDAERSAVLEVPAELQLHIAQALETGDPDEDLLGWLRSEDLLTSEGWSEWSGPAMPLAGGESAGVDESTAGPGRFTLSRLALAQQAPDEVHGWIDQTSEGAVEEALDRIFRRGGAARVRLHLDWAGRFPGNGLLEWIVVEAKRRAANALEVAFELALAPAAVTPAVAGFLAQYPVHVRLRCGGTAWNAPACCPAPGPCAGQGPGAFQEPPGRQPWLPAEAAVRLLVEALEDRLTVQCVLGDFGAMGAGTADGSELRGLWNWAKSLGVRHVDAVLRHEPAESRATGRPAPASLLSRVRNFRRDLLAILDETSSALETDSLMTDFQPLTRIVRRQMRSELPSTGGELSVFGGALLPELPCQGCWARQLCSHSAFVASPLGGEEAPEPTEERCAFWLAEVEVALRLYHRLTQADPIPVLRAFEEAPRLPAAGGNLFHLLAAKPS
jgi:hypothetical protein